jgi:hypothetical protein
MIWALRRAQKECRKELRPYLRMITLLAVSIKLGTDILVAGPSQSRMFIQLVSAEDPGLQ